MNWYAGDIHVHRNCGENTKIFSEGDIFTMMEQNDLAIISLLADMGNGEVKEAPTDLLKVNGEDRTRSKPDRIIHWDAEWHWDATYSAFDHQALGGHLVLLGLRNAQQIWEESPYKILAWAHAQGALGGFCHLQYLNDSIQNNLNCCIPIDLPVEAALGNIDFISEDVEGSEAAINAYYKLLNCGFKIGLTAGTDFPCNDYKPIGSLLTYARIKGNKLTYRKWINGIKNGQTVISRNGHKEFIDVNVNEKYKPGDEIKLKEKSAITLNVKWSAMEELSGRIELIRNGVVETVSSGSAALDEPFFFSANVEFGKSGWICVRRVDNKGNRLLHTAPIYVTVDEKPVRANAQDAEYFVRWIDNLIINVSEEGKWNKYFTHNRNEVIDRYRKARETYSKIAEASKSYNK
jgi:hypothetical protein